MRDLLKLFSNRRRVQITELDALFSDLVDGRLNEDMYSRNEVEDIMKDALDTFKTDVEKEMETIVHMFVILLKQMFDGANREGVDLKLNISAIEDQSIFYYI